MQGKRLRRFALATVCIPQCKRMNTIESNDGKAVSNDMTLYSLANIIACIGAFAGFFYGAFHFFRPRKAVYAQMITLAVGCMALGRLYQAIRITTTGDFSSRFHLGVLGIFGALMFLFSANFGAIDGLLDDRSKKDQKYRIISLSAPAMVMILYFALFLFSDQQKLVKLLAFLVCCLIACTSYYNLKHFIFPDVEYGVIRCLRTYNLLAMGFEFLCLAEIIAQSRDWAVVTLMIGILTAIILPMIVISVERGYRKWLT